jgi:hypothetical protein
MGLLTILKKIKQKEKEIRLLILCVRSFRVHAIWKRAHATQRLPAYARPMSGCHGSLPAPLGLRGPVRWPIQLHIPRSFGRPRSVARKPLTLRSAFPPRLVCSGLDNAGKTTVLKKFMGEDINSISPTLGFNIQTLEYRG